jgi:predicted nucleic acid-binding protein
LKDREKTLAYLSNIRRLPMTSHHELMELIEIRKLSGLGIGSVDLHLISACLLSGAELMTFDKNLSKAWELCKQ